MEIQQNLPNQDEIDKLRTKNEELKKNLEREQALHGMLYKEWKDLDEQRTAREFELQNPKPKNLFYKYAFYIILILLIPAAIFLSTQKNGKPANIVKDQTHPPKDSAIIENPSKPNDAVISTRDSTLKPGKDVTTSTPEAQPQVLKEQPTPPKPENNIIQPDTIKRKSVALVKQEPDLPLSDSVRDSIYWIGWNAYYKRTASHFRKSSQKYQAWLEGYNDGRKDAKKLLAKDSIPNRR